jgi:restriction system protein
MSSSKLPGVAELTPLVLEALRHHGGTASNQEIEEFVIERLGLTAPQRQARHCSGRPRTELDYRLAWARTALRRKAKINREEKGIWALCRDREGLE